MSQKIRVYHTPLLLRFFFVLSFEACVGDMTDEKISLISCIQWNSLVPLKNAFIIFTQVGLCIV